MKKPFLAKGLLAAFLMLCSAGYSYAQSTVTAKYRWSENTFKLPSDVAKNYVSLPTADYTPPHDLSSWSAGEALQAYAQNVAGSVSVQLMLVIDEQGDIKDVKVIKASDNTHAAAVKGLINGTKTGGPSYLHNKAIACYVPCTITIEARRVRLN
ncbi:energy transducer TonB [Chitinophaga sedimenti]|uniref:energy transducer TonB n=1 Tax=Chitinophaga sedimenti TaxID=2033606 RepID=UPI00200606F6|nr:energy transducer TonB [Chitinophaga sedimenti]MCK7557213.1 energy transducer TonB [Chitinophaga sedimenti]